jgi:putative transposase
MPLARAIQNFEGQFLSLAGRARFDFTWQEGYGAFSVSASNRDAVKHYIEHQIEHHAKHSFEEEFVSLLRKSRVAYDPKVVFG